MAGETHTRVATPTDVGSRLRAAREAKQLSVREVAKTTKIPVYLRKTSYARFA